ncbi:hypothetical protein h2es_0909 [Rickettsiales endosymbiont of Trichoplax sp. H2]|nr:hypothetical protein [Rickettsiales endosymbiont of Trichoplax sp. H2]
MSIRKGPKGYRFPVSVISHVVWLYHRFNHSYRDVKEQLLYRGIGAISFLVILKM